MKNSRVRTILFKFSRFLFVLILIFNASCGSVTNQNLPEPLVLIPYRKGDRWGYCDRNKKIVIECKYDFANSFSESLALVRLNDRYGYIDSTGVEVIPLKYDDAWSFSEGFAGVKLNGKWGFVDKTGKEVIPLKYDDVSDFSKRLAKVKLNPDYAIDFNFLMRSVRIFLM